MASRIYLSNDSVTSVKPTGYQYDEDTFWFNPVVNDTSVHGTTSSAVMAELVGPLKANGVIQDVFIGTRRVAVSASGFVSADLTCTVRINSVAVCSTDPKLTGPVGSAGLAVRQATNSPTSAANVVSAVVNTASNAFSTGDMLQLDWSVLSAGSAAAGQSGTGFYIGVLVRYAAR